MALQRVARRSVPDDVYDQLLAELLDGEIGPGEPLPSERRLAEVLGVSRPAVREALQRLAHAGLVEVRQGDATTVRDFRRFGGLDLLPRLLAPGGALDLKVARSILEARLHVGPKIAELAAERGGPAMETALDDAVAALAAEEDPVARQRRALEVWRLLVEAADSIAFTLMFNGMLAAYEPAIEALSHVITENTEAYQRLADAVISGDAVIAREAAVEVLGSATTGLLEAIDALEGQA